MTNSVNNDRRIQRTRNALRQAMMALLIERGWDDLNVLDICERANIGRSTFYLHYQNKEELLASGLNDLRCALLADGAAMANNQPMPMPFLRGLIAHVEENQKVFRSIVGRRSGHVVQIRFRKMILQLIEEDLANSLPPGWQRDAASHYIAGALVELLGWWVDSKNAPSGDDIENYFRKITEPAITSSPATRSRR